MLSDGELRTVADGDRGWQHPPAGHKQVPAERTRHLPGRCHAEVSPHSVCVSEVADRCLGILKTHVTLVVYSVLIKCI